MKVDLIDYTTFDRNVAQVLYVSMHKKLHNLLDVPTVGEVVFESDPDIEKMYKELDESLGNLQCYLFGESTAF